MKILLFGCGYLGTRCARLWGGAGHEVVVMSRDKNRSKGFSQNGWHSFVGDVTDPVSLANLPEVDAVLFAVGFDKSAGLPIEEVYAGGVRNVLAALPESVRRFVYISTTGVYGDAAGDWVDEQTPPDPSRAGGIASLAAEEALRASRFASRSVILRLAGIYGPERLPYLQRLESGQPIEAVPTGHLNLIHVDDAARIVQQVAARDFDDEGPLTYCVSDGHPVVREDFYKEIARQLGVAAPLFSEPPAASPRAIRAMVDRRVSNRRLLAETKVAIRYPSYREGLAQILAAPF